ncbi:MAG: TSUP family transporter [Christensenellaceae bacterium]
MLKTLVDFLLGVVSGIFGGMGMGGGTLLIPLLMNFSSVTQHQAQAINLVSFIPMSIVAIIIHAKNKLIVVKNSLFLIVPSVIFAVIFSFLSKFIHSDLLKRLFGVFLLGVGFYLLFNNAKNKSEKSN